MKAQKAGAKNIFLYSNCRFVQSELLLQYSGAHSSNVKCFCTLSSSSRMKSAFHRCFIFRFRIVLSVVDLPSRIIMMVTLSHSISLSWLWNRTFCDQPTWMCTVAPGVQHPNKSPKRKTEEAIQFSVFETFIFGKKRNARLYKAK